MKNRDLFTVLTIGSFALAGCKSESLHPEAGALQSEEEAGALWVSDEEVGTLWVFEDTYKSGLPIDKWKKWPLSASIEQRSFKGVPIAVVQYSTPNSYGNTFKLHIYYKANKDDATSGDWRECLRFSARSYLELKTVFDEEGDQLTIFGVVPSDKSEENLLIRRRFHDSFVYYIPEHG